MAYALLKIFSSAPHQPTYIMHSSNYSTCTLHRSCADRPICEFPYLLHTPYTLHLLLPPARTWDFGTWNFPHPNTCHSYYFGDTLYVHCVASCTSTYRGYLSNNIIGCIPSSTCRRRLWALRICQDHQQKKVRHFFSYVFLHWQTAIQSSRSIVQYSVIRLSEAGVIAPKRNLDQKR